MEKVSKILEKYPRPISKKILENINILWENLKKLIKINAYYKKIFINANIHILWKRARNILYKYPRLRRIFEEILKIFKSLEELWKILRKYSQLWRIILCFKKFCVLGGALVYLTTLRIFKEGLKKFFKKFYFLEELFLKILKSLEKARYLW